MFALESNVTGGEAEIRIPCGVISHIDVVVAGTYAYKLQFWQHISGTTMLVTECKFLAYEIK